MARQPGKYGDWDTLKAWREDLKRHKWKKKFADNFRSLGRAVQARVRGHIKAQDLAWPPLSPVTVQLKGGSGTIYVHTSAYYNKINATLTPAPEGGLVLVVAVRGKHPSGISMQELAEMLEYGTSGMKARPLWTPTFAELDTLPEMRELKALGVKFSFRNS